MTEFLIAFFSGVLIGCFATGLAVHLEARSEHRARMQAVEALRDRFMRRTWHWKPRSECADSSSSEPVK